MIKVLGVIVCCIVLLRVLLFSDGSITLYNLTEEIAPTVNQNRFSVYVQKSSFRGLHSFLDHGGANREFIFHKVARLDLALDFSQRSAPKITTILEGDSEDTYNRFNYTKVPNSLLDQFCRDDNGPNNCNWKVENVIDKKRIFHIYNQEKSDNSSFVIRALGEKEGDFCHFKMVDFKRKLSGFDIVEKFNFKDITFHLLTDDENAFYTILKSKVDAVTKYHLVTAKGCLDTVDVEELALGANLKSDMELGNIRMLDNGLYLAENTREKFSLVLIDLINSKVNEIIRKRIHYFFDQDSRRLVFYDMIDITMPLIDRLHLEVYSIDNELWDKTSYVIEFPYDSYIYNAREFLPTIFY